MNLKKVEKLQVNAPYNLENTFNFVKDLSILL